VSQGRKNSRPLADCYQEKGDVKKESALELAISFFFDSNGNFGWMRGEVGAERESAFAARKNLKL